MGMIAPIRMPVLMKNMTHKFDKLLWFFLRKQWSAARYWNKSDVFFFVKFVRFHKKTSISRTKKQNATAIISLSRLSFLVLSSLKAYFKTEDSYSSYFIRCHYIMQLTFLIHQMFLPLMKISTRSQNLLTHWEFRGRYRHHIPLRDENFFMNPDRLKIFQWSFASEH